MSEERSLDRDEPGRQPAFIAFVVLIVVAFPLLLALGNYRWFFSDDWDFVAARDAGSLDDLLRPHNEHWSTVPILLYRGMWNLFGLHSYLPYRVPVVLAHLAVAVLLLVALRRARVSPWLATSLAALFALFGTGDENIVWAFQVGFVGSMAFGLGQALLADHDGPSDHRDALGLACGLMALMCSGVGVTTTAIVGLAVLLRRGLRPALLHTVPLALCYGAWYLGFGRDAYFSEFGSAGSPGEVIEFVFLGLRGSIDALSKVPLVGYLVAGVAALGWLRLLTDPAARPTLRRRVALPVAMAAGAVLFMVSSGVLRAGLSVERAYLHTRYLHLVLAMLVPALGVGLDTLARRVRWGVPVAALVIALCIPGNLWQLHVQDRDFRSYFDGIRAKMLGVAYDADATTVPRTVRPETTQARDVTIGWLVDARRHGDLPRVPVAKGVEKVFNQLSFTFDQRAAPFDLEGCTKLRTSVHRRLRRDEPIVFRGGDIVVTATFPNLPPTLDTQSFTFRAGDGALVIPWRDPVDVVLSSSYSHSPPELCHAPRR